jgi:methionyl aminopeptidase
MSKVKTEREVGLIRASCELVVATFNMLDRLIEPGITTGEIDRQIEKFIVSHGGVPAFKGYVVNRRAFPANSCISVESEVVHGIPGGRKLRAGEIVGIDVGVRLGDFYGDAAKSYAVGAIDDLRARLMQVTHESLYKGIAQARAGNRLSDISHAVQSHVEAAGFSIVRELVGHGVGRRLHEEPQIPNFGPPRQGPKLKSGMVLAIEPMVNAGGYEVDCADDGWTVMTRDGKPSAHFEHTVLITNGEAEILTKGI